MRACHRLEKLSACGLVLGHRREDELCVVGLVEVDLEALFLVASLCHDGHGLDHEVLAADEPHSVPATCQQVKRQVARAPRQVRRRESAGHGLGKGLCSQWLEPRRMPSHSSTTTSTSIPS